MFEVRNTDIGSVAQGTLVLMDNGGDNPKVWRLTRFEAMHNPFTKDDERYMMDLYRFHFTSLENDDDHMSVVLPNEAPVQIIARVK